MVSETNRIVGLVFIVLAGFVQGCGLIADQDLIVVAELDGEPIRRGDLSRILREMPDEERPLIQNKGDLLEVLNHYIDEEIKGDLAEELKAAGKISVPREAAAQAYFQKHPEDRQVFAIQDPAALGLTERDLVAMKTNVEFGIDEEEERLLRDQALFYLAQQAARQGAITISEEEFREAFERRKEDLRFPEHVEFLALRFPTEMEDAVARAAEVRRKVDSGTSFDAIVEEYRVEKPELVLRSGLDRNPARERFELFWSAIEESNEGDVVGPVLLPSYNIVETVAGGASKAIEMPPAHLVLEVLQHNPERGKSLGEAKEDLRPDLLLAKMREKLREQYNVKIYPDKLPDPAGYGDQFEDYMIKTE